MKEFNLRVTSSDAGMRLDLYLLRFSQTQHLGVSRNFIQGLIRQKHVIPGDKTINLNAHYKIKAGQVFKLRIPEQPSLTLAPEDIPLDIRFEDEDVVVVDKPAGMVVHPGAGNCQGTLVNSLLFHCRCLSSVNSERPGIVHRLDKDASGLIVVAKNNPSHRHLARQFAKHSVLRKYVAIVKGKVELNEDIIELPIGRHPRQREKMAAFDKQDYAEAKAGCLVKSGDKHRPGLKKYRYARTKYRVIRRRADITLLELEPFTGRTHQLRVHLSSIGHPILGDKKYARAIEFSRLALHAHHLGFIHPGNNKFIEVKTAVPEEFLKPFLF